MIQPYHCPICSKNFWHIRCLVHKTKPHLNCPKCDTYERHRFLWLYLQMETDFFRNRYDVLHVSPSPALQLKLSKQPLLNYQTSALNCEYTDYQFDITNIDCPDNHTDIVIAIHVLEHIEDDIKAMAEIYRVLRPGGWALFMVPLRGHVTHEDLSIVSPAERLKHFGQEDHVRYYGLDIIERLRGVGFQVKTRAAADLFDKEGIYRFNLFWSARVYQCIKPLNKG